MYEGGRGEEKNKTKYTHGRKKYLQTINIYINQMRKDNNYERNKKNTIENTNFT